MSHPGGGTPIYTKVDFPIEGGKTEEMSDSDGQKKAVEHETIFGVFPQQRTIIRR